MKKISDQIPSSEQLFKDIPTAKQLSDDMGLKTMQQIYDETHPTEKPPKRKKEMKKIKKHNPKGLGYSPMVKDRTRQFKMRISDDELWWYHHFAKSRGMTTSHFVRKAVLFYMKNHPEHKIETEEERRTKAVAGIAEIEAITEGTQKENAASA